MKKIEVIREKKVFVFGNPYLKECTIEENSFFFKDNIDPYLVGINRNMENKADFIFNNLNNMVSELRLNNTMHSNLTTSLAIALFIASNPTSCFALDYVDKIFTAGMNAVSILTVGLIKGVLIITALRLLNEYINGSNNYRIFDILKECIGVILLTVLIPRLPIIFGIFAR